MFWYFNEHLGCADALQYFWMSQNQGLCVLHSRMPVQWICRTHQVELTAEDGITPRQWYFSGDKWLVKSKWCGKDFFWWRCLDVIWLLGQAFSFSFGFHFDGSVVWGYWERQLAGQLMRIWKSILSLLSRKTAPLGCLLPLSDRVWQECLTCLSEPRKIGCRITQENQPSTQQNSNKIEAVYFPRAAQCAVTCAKRLMHTLISVHSVKSRDLGRATRGKGSVDYV